MARVGCGEGRRLGAGDFVRLGQRKALVILLSTSIINVIFGAKICYDLQNHLK